VAARATAGDKGPSELGFNTSRLERGLRVRKMAALTAVKLARELGCSVGWLLVGEGSGPVVQNSRSDRDAAPIVAEEIDE